MTSLLFLSHTVAKRRYLVALNQSTNKGHVSLKAWGRAECREERKLVRGRMKEKNNRRKV